MPRRNDIAKILIIGSGPIVAAACALVLLGLFIPADACEISLGSVHVTSDFQIMVRHVQQPIGGITVAIYRSKGVDGEIEKDPLLRLVTDKNGTTKVRDLRDGTYMVATEGPGQGAAVYAIVGWGAKGKAKNEVVLGWPAKEIIQTKRLSGQLLNSNVRTPFEKTVGSAQLELWTAGVQAPIALESTTPDGQFQFLQSSPGIYILRVKARGGPEGEIALDLQPSTADGIEFLTLHLLETSCGLTYRHCHSTASIDLASRYVGVVTPKGVPFKSAAYRIEDRQGNLLAEGETDGEGGALIPADVEGDVRLELARGEISVDQSVRLKALANVPSRHQVMGIHFDGVCSSLSLENHATSQ
jgi:hypothetical protein